MKQNHSLTGQGLAANSLMTHQDVGVPLKRFRSKAQIRVETSKSWFRV